MPLVSFTKDPEDLTMTVVAEFAAPVERVWDAYADPRQLEKFWGPVEWPATFTRHDFAAGGRSDYYMTGPDGETIGRATGSSPRWTPDRSFTVLDGFADDDGAPNDGHALDAHDVHVRGHGCGRRVTNVTTFQSLEAIEQRAGDGHGGGHDVGHESDRRRPRGPRDLRGGAPRGGQILSDTQVRVSRVIRGSVDQVWRAHHEPELMKRWLLGPDGWTMPVCEIAHARGRARIGTSGSR